MRLLSGERLDQDGFPDEDEVELFFPDILTYDFLREEYESEFDSFMSQYMLDTYGAAEIVFGEREVLSAMVPEERVPLEGTPHIVFRLPCRSLKWHTTSGAVGLLQADRMFITDIAQGHYKPSLTAKLIHDIARKHGTHTVNIIESPGASVMQAVVENYALTTGWNIYISWIPFEEDSGVRDTHIRSLEATIAGGRLLFSSGVKTKPLITGFVEYGMMEENGLPDVIAHCADALPRSIASEFEADEAAWDMLRERDHFNMVYCRGRYAPPEPEPEPEEMEPAIEDRKFTEAGLEILIPGLEY
jgi:hypothetical protein